MVNKMLEVNFPHELINESKSSCATAIDLKGHHTKFRRDTALVWSFIEIN